MIKEKASKMINIIAVDDESLARTALVEAINQVFEQANIKEFEKPSACITYVQTLISTGEKLDYAFLEIKMDEMSGLVLAKQLKEWMPSIRIMFVTAYNFYASEAFKVHAKGYILKPVDAEAIRDALDDMEIDWRKEIREQGTKRVTVSTFGKFQVSVEGKKLKFSRSKSKELFALLIDRKGQWMESDEIIDIIWEGEAREVQKKNYFRIIKAFMLKTLRASGVEDVVIQQKRRLAINTALIDCDYYLYAQGDVSAVNSYHGIYMEEYSWAEFTAAYLSSLK